MIKITRIGILLELFLSINFVNGQNLYRSYYPDSILYSKEINIPSFENDFNENISFYYEIWRQNNIVSQTLLIESNDTLYYALSPFVFSEHILPNFKRRNKEEYIAKLDFIISLHAKNNYLGMFSNYQKPEISTYTVDKF